MNDIEIVEALEAQGADPMQQDVVMPEPQQIPLEETNIAEDLEEEELEEIAKQVIEGYESDLESREEWDEKHASWLKLYYQTDTAQEPPWDGASEEGLPSMTEAVNQFQSRTYKAFFPNRYFVEAIPTGKGNTEARERGERVAAHMNWQLDMVDKSYKRNKNQMFMAVALHGSDFTKTYYSHIKGRTVIERVPVQDLIIPYHVGPKSIEDIERKTHRKFTSVNETKILAEMGYYLHPAVPFEDENDLSASQDASDDMQGITEDATKKDLNRDALVLEQHCLLDLDEDGIAEPYIVWVDKTKKKVLRIQVRYEVDEFGAPAQGKEPVEYFTHYQFLPNPDGFYGFGFGHLLAKINIALNKLTRMFIDAGELSTVGNLTYLIGEALGLDGDEFELSMGQGNKIPRMVDDIRKQFVPLNFKGPAPELSVMIEYLQNATQRISASSDVLAGQPDKVYQPEALMTMLEQGLQLYSSVQEFLGYSMEEELQKVYRLNAKYMTQEEHFMGKDQQITVAPEDYRDDFLIRPIFDPKYSTRSQKVAKARATYEFMLSDPVASQNQQSIYLAGKRYLEALDTESIDEVYPAPQVPEVARIDDQILENSYFVMPADKRPLFDVFPDQDHLEHIRQIDSFIQYLDGAEPMEVPNIVGGDPGISRMVQSLANEQKQELIANLLRHRAQHLSFLYAQNNGSMDEQGNPMQEAEAPADNAELAQVMQLMSDIGAIQ